MFSMVGKILRNSTILLIKLYRNYLSCLMLPRCRFYPSCSAYALEAIEKKGLLRGLGMLLRRLFRCHPFSRTWYYDPVENS
jgi:hypothetical protein